MAGQHRGMVSPREGCVSHLRTRAYIVLRTEDTVSIDVADNQSLLIMGASISHAWLPERHDGDGLHSMDRPGLVAIG